MMNFIPYPSWSQHPEESRFLKITSVGYHDFHFVAGEKNLRRQGFYTLHYILSGRGEVFADDRHYSLGPGDTFFLLPEEAIMYYPDPADPWQYVWFSFSDPEFGALVSASRSGDTCRPVLDEAAVFAAVRELFDGFTHGRCDPLEITSVFYQLICHTQKPAAPRKDIGRIRDRIDAGYTVPEFRLGDVCRELGWSRAQMCREFRREYGTTAEDYLLEKRMTRARTLLRTTSLPVYSVAYSCGYSDSAHFMRLFKARVGVSAGAYRKSKESEQEETL